MYGLRRIYETDPEQHAQLAPWCRLPKNLGNSCDCGGTFHSACGAFQSAELILTMVAGRHAWALRGEFNHWYMTTPLPTRDWDETIGIGNTVQTAPNSSLCRVSRAVWDSAYLRVWDGTTAFDTTRCSKLHGDVVKKVVQLLNLWEDGRATPLLAPGATFEHHDTKSHFPSRTERDPR